jgi:hypothetical protein
MARLTHGMQQQISVDWLLILNLMKEGLYTLISTGVRK